MRDILRVVFSIFVVLCIFAVLLCVGRYATLKPGQNFTHCVNNCGNGVCQNIVCFSSGCPCAETQANCSQDCRNMKNF
jgi:hypothetical protein